MAGSHVHALYRHGRSALHRTAPHVKIFAAFGFLFAVIATPREAVWAFALYFAVLIGLAAAAGLGIKFVATRMVVEIPFILVALLLPFFGGGEQVEIFGLLLSRNGLWEMWNIVAKATLGLLTSVVLAGTTQIPDLLRGFDTLRVPRTVTAIMGFLVRYLDVVLGQFRRMAIAMRSRAYDPSWLGHVKPYAASVGTMFVRSYERGERVYLAMASRGYTGTMPVLGRQRTPAGTWALAVALVLGAWITAAVAWGVR